MQLEFGIANVRGREPEIWNMNVLICLFTKPIGLHYSGNFGGVREEGGRRLSFSDVR